MDQDRKKITAIILREKELKIRGDDVNHISMRLASAYTLVLTSIRNEGVFQPSLNEPIFRAAVIEYYSVCKDISFMKELILGEYEGARFSFRRPVSLPVVGDGSIKAQIEYLYKKFEFLRSKGYAHMTPNRPTKNPQTAWLETPIPFEVPQPFQEKRQFEAFEVFITSYPDKHQFLALVEYTYDLWWAVANVAEGGRDGKGDGGDKEASG